jgi:hypothetical protein
MRSLAFIGLALFVTVSCGGESENGASGGAGGSGGSATGGSSTGGSAGSSTGGSATGGTASGGSAGSSTGGSAGSSTGGSAGSSTGGSAGATSASAECTADADCKVFEDCCTCAGVPTGENPAICKMACTDQKCKQLGVSSTEVACIAGRCVKGFDCDTSKVTCKMATPICNAGETPQVSGTCYTGDCVPADECHSVPDCAKCAATDACVSYVAQLGPQRHCVSIPAACGGNASCSCLGPTTCISPFNACSDLSGIKGVTCGCPVC